jgi:serine/threonine-protein kinase
MTTGTASQLQAGESSTGPVRPGEVVADKYVVERTLGVGGMGVVVLARDQVLDRQVAIKFLLPKLAGSETAVHRFVREARAATRVTSEHVVRLLEIDKLPSGTPFFVMEHLEGSDLRALLREHGPLSPSTAVDYVLQALQALAEGHTKGIVHRDIKPGNLFLTTRADGTPLIKVLDFGIAKTVESDAAESTALTSSDDVRLGSPAYMPPEQLQNPRDVDTRSDIWSLGATLYELLCGKPPFEAPGYLELASRILSSPPVPIAEQDMPSTLPRGLEQVLKRCLEKDRSARFANAAELAAALAPFGSEDARVSLTRVTGLLSAAQGAHSGPHRVLSDSGTCATTMTVGELPAARPSSDKRSTQPLGPPAAPRGRSWLVVVGAAAIVAGVVALARSSDTPVTAAAAPSAAAPVAEPTPVRALPVLAAPVASTASSIASPLPSAAVASKPKLPSLAKPRTIERAAPLASTAVALTAHAAGRVADSAPAASVAPVPPETALPGRSAEIERLIQQRR